MSFEQGTESHPVVTGSKKHPEAQLPYGDFARGVRVFTPWVPFALFSLSQFFSLSATMGYFVLGGWRQQPIEKKNDPDDEGRERLS